MFSCSPLYLILTNTRNILSLAGYLLKLYHRLQLTVLSTMVLLRLLPQVLLRPGVAPAVGEIGLSVIFRRRGRMEELIVYNAAMTAVRWPVSIVRVVELYHGP
jgi:hypothetical protein